MRVGAVLGPATFVASLQKKQEKPIVSVALPTPDQLRALADQCGLALTDEDVTSFRGLMQDTVNAYNAVAAMPEPGGKSAQRLVSQIDRQGRGERQTEGQGRSPQGQHHAGRGADDERLLDAGRLCA
jgi:hypothetical protein